MSIAAEPVVEAVGARTAAAGGSKAAASKAAKSRWAAKQASVLRGRGMSDAQIRAELAKAGYDATTSKTAAPSPAPTPAPAPAAAASPADPASTDPTGQGAADRAAYLSGKPGATINSSGLLLGLVLYPVGLAFIRGGTAGMRAWFDAKFLNKVSGTQPASAGAPAAANPSRVA